MEPGDEAGPPLWKTSDLGDTFLINVIVNVIYTNNSSKVKLSKSVYMYKPKSITEIKTQNKI